MSINFRNLAPTLVETFFENGGVEPDDFSFSIAHCVATIVGWVILKNMLIATIF